MDKKDRVKFLLVKTSKKGKRWTLELSGTGNEELVAISRAIHAAADVAKMTMVSGNDPLAAIIKTKKKKEPTTSTTVSTTASDGSQEMRANRNLNG